MIDESLIIGRDGEELKAEEGEACQWAAYTLEDLHKKSTRKSNSSQLF
jgi:hypothetical protein